MMPMGRDELAVKPVRHDVSPDFLALSAPAVSRVDHKMGEFQGEVCEVHGGTKQQDYSACADTNNPPNSEADVVLARLGRSQRRCRMD